ncbi:MAG TPA: hypothetical protein VME22_26365 [Solirubrobacteraceae bacterium]|nr:hypothetical protein [Solirubrobacteraceae bacterium]
MRSSTRTATPIIHGGLEGLIRRRERSRLPLDIHLDAWRERRTAFLPGGELRLPPPSRHDLQADGLEVVEERAHSLLLDGAVLVSGQVKRITEFESGFRSVRRGTVTGGGSRLLCAPSWPLGRMSDFGRWT